MPQMKPILWVLLFSYFLITYVISLNILYFYYYPLYKSIIGKKFIKYYMIW